VAGLLLELARRRRPRILVGLEPPGRNLEQPVADGVTVLAHDEQPTTSVPRGDRHGAGVVDRVDRLDEPRGQPDGLAPHVEHWPVVHVVAGDELDISVTLHRAECATEGRVNAPVA